MAIPQRFPIPSNDDDFERICLELLRRHWSRPGLEIFGKRGERQFGIDILDVGGEIPIYAAQCKLKEPHKNLPPLEIQTEVDEAKKFTPPLGKYAILTTGKVSTQAQRAVREINQTHKATNLFEVEVLTWDHISALLPDYPDVHEQFYGDVGIGRGRRMETHLLSIRDGFQSLTSKSIESELDSQIDSARDCITNRKFQLATFLLNHIWRKKDDLTPRQKFRVLSNLGAAALGQGKPQEAARFFLEATAHQPDDEQAKTNEVLAYLLVGDFATCHAKATLLRQQYPVSARLAALWVTTAPTAIHLFELEGAEINSVLRSDAEVSLAFARRALAELDFDKALRYAETARESAPDWAQSLLALAEINIGMALKFRPMSEDQKALLQRAEEGCSRALDLSRLGKDKQTETAALVRRVDVRLLLEEKDAAVEDAEHAHRLQPDDPHVLCALGQVRIACGNVDQGVSFLSRAHELDARSDVSLIYGKALFDRGREGDVENALKVFRKTSLSDFRSEIRPSIATQVIQCLAKKKDWPEANLYVDQISELLHPIVVKIIRGFLAHYQESRQDAERFALEAKSLLVPDINPETKEFLARLFMMVGRPADALPLWQDLFQSDVPWFDIGRLLDCAARLQRDDVILDACDRLHIRGVDDWQILDFEIPYLQKYNIDAAIERLQAFIHKHPDHELAKLQLSLIGLLVSKPEMVRAKEEELPAVDDLPVEYAVPAVQVLKFGGNPTVAVDYSYRYLRLHFNEVQAHKALIVSMMPGLSAPDMPPTLEVVGADSAVCYQERSRSDLKWVVLEDTDSPSGDFEEISLDSDLAKELIGKKVGDVVVIAKGRMQDRVATLVQILPKYVRRYQDSMAEMQVRFGAASSVESVLLGPPEDSQSGIESLLASIERRANAVAGIRDTYRSAPLSLHLYGTPFGSNAYEAIMDLAQEQDEQVKCSLGTSGEGDRAAQALRTTTALVVDITALATLRLLGLTKVLSSVKYKFLLSQATWVALHEMLSEARINSAPGGTLSYQNGRHVMYEETAESKELRNRENEEFVRLVEMTTELRSGVGLAALQPTKREILEKGFGRYGAESMVIASDPNYVLWTDDLIQAQFSAQEFGVRRVWTQLVLGTLADAGLITPDEYSEASARLIGMEFVATSFDDSTLLAGFRLSEWRPQQRPATQFVKVFSNPAADKQRLVGIFISFIEKLYREPIAVASRCAVMQALLDALADAPQTISALINLRKLSRRVFGINAVGQQQFEECFDLWLKHRNEPLILPA